MKKLLATILLLIPFAATAQVYSPNSDCPIFTTEQRKILRMAYTVGSQYDEQLYNAVGDHIGHSLAAIVWRESFVERHIVRFNTGDGQLGSWGVGHVQLTTLWWMDGILVTWENRDKLAPEYIHRLLSDDYYAINSAYRYLKYLTIRERSFYNARMRYRGTGQLAIEYANDVSERVQILIRCGV